MASFGETNTRTLWTLAIVLSVALIFGFWRLYYSPQKDEIAELQTQVNELELQVERGRTLERELPKFRAEVAELQAKYKQMLYILPASHEIDKLLKGVQDLASKANLSMRQFRPTGRGPREFYDEYPVAINVSGTYHNLGAFFDSVAKFSRLVNIKDISIQAVSTQTSRMTIRATCKAITFIFREDVDVQS